MKINKPTNADSNEELSKLSLKQLKERLKASGDIGPKYLFNDVEKNTDLRDYRYVFWLDLMGARNLMKLSLPRAARSVMKIHAAALLAKQEHTDLEINPVMDGVYGVVKDRDLLETCLSDIMASLAKVFIHERVAGSRFMVRAGVAFGPLVPGNALAQGSAILQQNTKYLGGVAIGMAISHAYDAEGSAPPFGVFIHESARAFAPRTKGSFPYRTNLWEWFDEDDILTWAVRRTLVDHFSWLEKNPIAAQYDQEAMKRHRALAQEYFSLHELTEQKIANKQ